MVNRLSRICRFLAAGLETAAKLLNQTGAQKGPQTTRSYHVAFHQNPPLANDSMRLPRLKRYKELMAADIRSETLANMLAHKSVDTTSHYLYRLEE
jgi:hypothetical protein